MANKATVATRAREVHAVASNELVPITLESAAANDDPNLYVSVNGHSFLLPKGERSMVPRYVADEINRAKAAQLAMDRRMRKMIEAAKQPKQQLG